VIDTMARLLGKAAVPTTNTTTDHQEEDHDRHQPHGTTLGVASLDGCLPLTWRVQTPFIRAASTAIIADVTQTSLNLDTSPDIERRQVESWRQMSAAQKAAMVTGLTRAAYVMTFAGVRQRHPDASSREHFLRVAVIVLGPNLARLAYPDAAGVISR